MCLVEMLYAFAHDFGTEVIRKGSKNSWSSLDPDLSSMQSFPSSLIYCWHFVRIQQLSHWSRPLLPCCFWPVLAWLKYQHMGHWKQKSRWLQANVGPFNMPLAWTNCHWLFTFRKKWTPAWLDILLHSKQLKLLITNKQNIQGMQRQWTLHQTLHYKRIS